MLIRREAILRGAEPCGVENVQQNRHTEAVWWRVYQTLLFRNLLCAFRKQHSMTSVFIADSFSTDITQSWFYVE